MYCTQNENSIKKEDEKEPGPIHIRKDILYIHTTQNNTIFYVLYL